MAGLYSVSLIPKRTHANCRCYTYPIIDGTTMNNLQQAFSADYRSLDRQLLNTEMIDVNPTFRPSVNNNNDDSDVPF